jgi:hypothetical protein
MNFHLGTLMPFGSSEDSLPLELPAARPVRGGIHYIFIVEVVFFYPLRAAHGSLKDCFLQ